ncbi:MAG: efflux RND transporter periplasmic adaptor subunit [bacterium]
MIKINTSLIKTSALICLLISLTACSHKPFMSSMPGGGGVPVESITLESIPVSQSEIYQANLISRYSVSLQPQISGQIAKITVKAGDRVVAGQLLIQIDKRKQEAALNSARADAAASKATVAQTKSMLNNYEIQRTAFESNLELNKKLYDRYTALFKQKTVSQQDLEKYTDGYNKAKADLDANTAQIESQKASIEAAKSNYEKATFFVKEQETQLQYYDITAPYSGIIGDIPVKEGGYVTETTQLLSITQNDPLEINIGLPIDKVFDIQKGLPVEVLDNTGKVIGNSKISFVSPKVDTNTQTILVKAILSNSKGILKVDQSIKVRVIYNKASGILVPTGAVSHLGGQDFIFIINKKDKQTFVKQLPIKLDDIQGDKYVVLSGLKNGDQIVSQGIQKLMDNAPVSIIAKGER